MKTFRTFGVSAFLAAALAFSGCAALNTFAGKATNDLLAINVAIAKAEPTVAAFIIRHISQADVYFQDVAATGVLSPAVIAKEAAIMTKVRGLNGSLPTSIAGIAQLLAQAFTDIQNLTTIK